MEISDAISTEEIRRKLQNLREYMPDEHEFTYDFGAYLATRLNSELNAIGFIIQFQLTLSDARRGIDGTTKKPSPASISGMPAPIYVVTEMKIPRIARAVCPTDFADKVDQVYAEIHKR